MIDQMIKVRMTNGKDIYGTNLDIGRYSVKHDCEVEHEYEHVNPSTVYNTFEYVGDRKPSPISVSVTFDYRMNRAMGTFNTRGVNLDKW